MRVLCLMVDLLIDLYTISLMQPISWILSISDSIFRSYCCIISAKRKKGTDADTAESFCATSCSCPKPTVSSDVQKKPQKHYSQGHLLTHIYSFLRLIHQHHPEVHGNHHRDLSDYHLRHFRTLTLKRSFLHKRHHLPGSQLVKRIPFFCHPVPVILVSVLMSHDVIPYINDKLPECALSNDAKVTSSCLLTSV